MGHRPSCEGTYSVGFNASNESSNSSGKKAVRTPQARMMNSTIPLSDLSVEDFSGMASQELAYRSIRAIANRRKTLLSGEGPLDLCGCSNAMSLLRFLRPRRRHCVESSSLGNQRVFFEEVKSSPSPNSES